MADLRDVHVLAVDDEQDALALVSELLEPPARASDRALGGGRAQQSRERRPRCRSSPTWGCRRSTGFSSSIASGATPIRACAMLPAAALTAYARTEDRMKALRAGFQIHLAKPIDPAELVTTIASLAKRFVPRPHDGASMMCDRQPGRTG